MLDVVAAAERDATKKDLLQLIEAQCSPEELRNLASTMLRVADALDQDWSSQAGSAFGFLSEARRIERNALNLAMRAKQEQDRRASRMAHLPNEFLGEPAWDMLLELFCQFAGGAKVSTKSLCAVSGVPATTALRTIDRLVDSGLVERSASQVDGRLVLLGLTREGVVSVGRALKRLG